MTATSMDLWGPFLLAVVVALAVTPLAIKLAPKIGAMDIPKDDRRMHSKAMPRFGGMAIFAGIVVSLTVYGHHDKEIVSILICCVIIYVVGVIDDLKNMKPMVKLAGQVVCGAALYFQGIRIEFVTNYFGDGNMIFGDVACFLVTVLWVVAITNAVNLIDGLDGLAAGISAISALCIGYVAYIHGQYMTTMAMMVIAGASLGFLPFNFHPAKTFMGDSGSQLLGFALAAFSIIGAVKSSTIIVVIIPALVMGLPIFDTLMAIIRRTMRHQSFATADKEHFHHRIMKAGYGQKRSVMLMYCVSAIMGIVAVLYSRGYTIEYLGLLAVEAMLIYVLLSDTSNRSVNARGVKIPSEKKELKEKK